MADQDGDDAPASDADEVEPDEVGSDEESPDDLTSDDDEPASRVQHIIQVAAMVAVIVILLIAASSIVYRSRELSPVLSGPPAGSAGTGLPVADPNASNAVDWETPSAQMHADDFRIVANGKTFLGVDPRAQLTSDAANLAEHTTLDRVWHEQGVEMRLSISFKTDGSQWWADQIRVYDGKDVSPAWVTFTGDFFRKPAGEPFTGDLTLPAPNDAKGGGANVQLTMRGLRVEAFTRPAVCRDQTAPFVLDVVSPDVHVAVGPQGRATAAVRLLDERCTQVADLAPFTFTWEADDPQVVRVDAACPSSNTGQDCRQQNAIEGAAAGQTLVRVTVRKDGAVVAQGAIAVTVQATTGSTR